MAVFDLDNLNEGAWFPYGEDAKVKLRACPVSVMQSIREKFVKHQVEYKKKTKYGEQQRIEYDEIKPADLKKIRAEIYDYTIQDWEGFTDPKGKALPCTRKTKVALMDGSPQFSTFVEESTAQLDKDIEAEKETTEKN